MPPTPTRPARLAVRSAKIAVGVTLLGLGVLGTNPTKPPADQVSVATHRMLDAHSCSTTGFDGELQPRSAVVRSPAGRLRFVDFDTGWRVFRARGPATLVAVCLDRPPA